MFYNDAAKRYIPIPIGLVATIMIQQGYQTSEIEKFVVESKNWINEITLKAESR